MEKEFASSKGGCRSLSADAKVSARKSIAMFLSLLLVLQIMLVAFQAFGAQSAYAASLPSGLVYKYAYGVRNDGISVFRNDGYDGVVVNSSGKIVFKEVYKDKTDTYIDVDGKRQSYTYKQHALNTNGNVIQDASYYGGNLLICKTVYDPHQETSKGPGGQTYSYTTDYRYYYGLLNPKTGKYVLPTKSSYDSVMAYCEKRGWKTEGSHTGFNEKVKLPNGATVQWKWVNGKGYRLVNAKGGTAKVAGYELAGDINSVIFRKNVAGGNLYYVRNAKGKIGAVNDKGKVLIPFEYSAYSDAGVGSSNILLKKGNAWSYFDLKSIGKTTTSQKAGWQKNSQGWQYCYSNGTYATGLKKIGKSTYYFTSTGIMKTGWQKISGSRYYFDKNGVMKTGWNKVGGKWYYMNSKGKTLTGWQTISGKKYYFTSTGVMKTGWQKISGAQYYFNSSGAMVKNKWVGNYWLGSNGKMAKNTWVDKGRYYVNSNGKWVPGKKK